MSRHVDVTVRALEVTCDPFVEHARRGRWLLQQALAARKLAGASRLKGEPLVAAARAAVRELGAPAAAQLLLTVALRKPRIAAAIAATIAAGGPGTSHLGPDQEMETHLVWFAQNFLRDALGGALAGVERHHVVLDLRARVLPEGALPSQRLLADRMPAYASRVLRDRDAADNPWVARFGLDAMAHRGWRGGPVDAAWIDRSTPRAGELHVVVAPELTRHLAVGDRFDAAP